MPGGLGHNGASDEHTKGAQPALGLRNPSRGRLGSPWPPWTYLLIRCMLALLLPPHNLSAPAVLGTIRTTREATKCLAIMRPSTTV